MRLYALIIAAAVPVAAGAQAYTPSGVPLITGDTITAPCSARGAASEINAWFVAMSRGDTVALQRLAAPGLRVFSAGRNGLAEPFFRTNRVRDLIEYVARRHRTGDHWKLVEVRFQAIRGQTLGFMPITRRDSRDPRATKGVWLGKAEYECGRGVRVLNLAPWPAGAPPYHPHSRPAA